MMQIDQVTKKYGTKEVIHEVDYQITPHKLTAFIGPNGAGKSTLLSIMSRLIDKDQGGIYLEKEEIKTWNQQQLAQKLSILKQANGTQLKLTVRELVAFGRFPHSKGKLTALDKEKIEEALSYLGLLDLAEESINTLSGGQLQRAYIAMVLAQDTEYIFLDEPLNNLDMNHAVQLMKTIRRLVDEKKKTVIIVLHDINFAASYADEIVAMKEGKIFKTGTTEEVITKEVLDDLYDMSVRVCEMEGKRFCLYFN
ncbi:ATP-binding cassette domain-containing protein [Vagococcus carniphilus]|uniref:ATP-binding cassette domain-containing protein n=2 Tax=Vagococcus carniphilus TaxID=218144 RepID=A0AAW8U2R9_9ENTE|nr:ATP-binding cassette domain-containing protein [Vagococcus carniphilus]MDT2813414.1 ATP-binding cassette domain-containing protein [Vagococcus carniphilus]MDT2830132.1 ATP-binding cassette domain-containing protein [Vagococcus carniphilus]MDT2833818.1 ATP-binding cassette domain-containing protein [Vagococcus carniphilus]MDT2838564.1 ATP-binding cassette domain-containing protein [Vagococcus carniphilus]MDT2853402.1 ATP-binding cassette domain-containing protein [Vagococcus carniphilus]